MINVDLSETAQQVLISGARLEDPKVYLVNGNSRQDRTIVSKQKEKGKCLETTCALEKHN